MWSTICTFSGLWMGWYIYFRTFRLVKERWRTLFFWTRRSSAKPGSLLQMKRRHMKALIVQARQAWGTMYRYSWEGTSSEPTCIFLSDMDLRWFKIWIPEIAEAFLGIDRRPGVLFSCARSRYLKAEARPVRNRPLHGFSFCFDRMISSTIRRFREEATNRKLVSPLVVVDLLYCRYV